MYIICILYVYYMYIICILYVYYMYIICILYVYMSCMYVCMCVWSSFTHIVPHIYIFIYLCTYMWGYSMNNWLKGWFCYIPKFESWSFVDHSIFFPNHICLVPSRTWQANACYVLREVLSQEAPCRGDLTGDLTGKTMGILWEYDGILII